MCLADGKFHWSVAKCCGSGEGFAGIPRRLENSHRRFHLCMDTLSPLRPPFFPKQAAGEIASINPRKKFNRNRRHFARRNSRRLWNRSGISNGNNGGGGEVRERIPPDRMAFFTAEPRVGLTESQNSRWKYRKKTLAATYTSEPGRIVKRAGRRLGRNSPRLRSKFIRADPRKPASLPIVLPRNFL